MHDDFVPPIFLKLSEAWQAGDKSRFVALCKKHQQVIGTEFRKWTRVPEAIRSNKNTVQVYCEILVDIANLMASLGEHRPLSVLSPARQTNPVEAWDQGLDTAQELRRVGRHRESIALCERVFDAMDSAMGPDIEDRRGELLGLLSANHFALDAHAAALEFSRRSSAAYQAAGNHRAAADQRSDTQLLMALSASPDGPIRRCRAAIARAQDLHDEGRHRASNRVLTGLFAEIQDNPDLAADYLAKIHGLRGTNHYRLGEVDQAAEWTAAAIQAAAAVDEHFVKNLYEENLAVIRNTQGT